MKEDSYNYNSFEKKQLLNYSENFYVSIKSHTQWSMNEDS